MAGSPKTVGGGLTIVAASMTLSVVSPVGVASLPSAVAADPDPRSGRVRIIDADGIPEPAADVAIFATPDLARTGRTFRSQLIARAVVGTDGTVDFPRVPRSRLQRYAHGSTVNLEIVAGKGRSFTSWSYPLQIPAGRAVDLTPPARLLQDPRQQRPATRSRVLAPSTMVNGALVLEPQPAPSARTRAYRRGLSCNESEMVREYYPWVKMNIARSDRRKVSARFATETGMESELGVAIKGLGDLGIHAAGTMSESSHWRDEFRPVRKRMVRYDTTWKYRRYRQKICLRSSETWYIRTTVRPISHQGDMRKRKPGAYTAPFCNRAVNGQTSTVDRMHSVTWSDGVDLSKWIGIDLSSKTGYSTLSSLQFVWRKRGQLCGQFTFPRNQDDGAIIGSLAAR